MTHAPILSGSFRDKRYRNLAFMLTAISSIGPFAIDTYLPSFPDMTRSLGTTAPVMQQTLTAYMLPAALMTLWHGAISDTLGRRRVIIAGLGLFAVASAGCALAPTIGVLIFCRVLQGMIGGAGMVVGRAIVRDVLDGPAAQRLMSLVSLTFALAPAVAPIIGGWLHVWFGWRSVFVFLMVLSGGVAVWSYLALPETLPPSCRRPFTPSFLVRTYREVLCTPPFVALCLTMMFMFAGMFVYILGAPVFLLQQLHLQETEFYWLYVPNTMAMMMGSWISGRLAGKLSRIRTVAYGFGIMWLAAALNVSVNVQGLPGTLWSILPISIYVFGMALSIPCLTLLALDMFPQNRGLAASCQAFIQSGGISLISAFVVPLVWATTLTFAYGSAALLGLGMLSLFGYMLTRNRFSTAIS